MKGYSTEYASAIVLFLGAVLKYFEIEITDNQLMEVVGGVVSLWAFGNLIYKRFKRGDVTPLGVRK